MRAVGGARGINRLSTCLLAALCLLALAAAPASAAASGSIGLRLLDAPINDDPRARLYITDHLAPGSVIHRRIEVSNTSMSPAGVALYPAAATIEAGSFVGAEGHIANELSTWTSVSPGEATVAAGERVTAMVTIAVPSDAAPGERYAAIWAEARSDPEEGAPIVQVNRVGIRIYLSVGPGGSPAADFTVDSLTAARSADGAPMILASVHNTGGRALDMHGSLLLEDGPGGLNAGPFAAELGTTLGVGESESVTILLDRKVPAGPWDARIELKSGLLERSAHAVVTFPKTGSAAPSGTAPDQSRGLYLLIPGGALVLGLFLWLSRERRRARREKPIEGKRREPALPVEPFDPDPRHA